MTDSDIILAVIGLRGELSPGGQATLDKLVNALQERERKRCAKIAQHATLPPYSFQIHPEIPFDKFNESAKTAAHSCAQGIATEILTPTA